VRALLKLSTAIDAFMEFLGALGVWLVSLLLLVGVYNVVVRKLGNFLGRNLASNTLVEGQWYLFSVIFFLGFAFVLKRNAHVRVDFLYAKLDARKRAWVNVFGTLLFLIPFCILGIYVTYHPVLTSWGLLPNGAWGPWELSSDAGGLPRAPIKTMIIVAFVLLLTQGISDLIKHSAVLVHAVQEQEVALLEEYEPQAVD
jgi:TRAP-type mannitol/chloroaromatic compound transport system permease small subunit